MTEWISIKERLPETGVWVLGLVRLPNGLWPMMVYHMGMAGGSWWNASEPPENDEIYPQDVRYWMPLPDSPEEETSNDANG